MTSLSDRFRQWYEYERDCNAKCLSMLASVPVANRNAPAFLRAVGRTAHLVAARQRWLFRLGHWPALTDGFPTVTVEDLPKMFAEIEAAWIAYLKPLDDAKLASEFEWTAPDGARLRGTIEMVLTQTFGHAWYHRGQIAQSVAEAGGTAVDTDYLYWFKPTRVG